MKRKGTFPGRRHWKEWLGKAVIGVGFYPKMWPEQKEWAQRFQPEKFVADLARQGHRRLDWGIPEGYGFVDMPPFPMHPGVRELPYNLFDRVCSACRKHDIRVLFCIVAAVGGTESNCPNDPEAVDRVCRHVRAVCDRYDMDGILFDGPFVHGRNPWKEDDTVQCALCAERFRKETGCAMPEKEDWNDPAWREYVRWVRGLETYLMARLTESVHAADTRLYVCYNGYLNTWARWNSVEYHEKAADISDGYFHELILDNRRQLQIGLAMKAMLAACPRSVPCVYHKTWELNHLVFPQGRPSQVHSDTMAFLALASAGTVCIHSATDKRAVPYPERTRVYAGTVREVLKRAPAFEDQVPAAHTGIHFGVASRDFYGGANDGAYSHSPVGAEKAMVESHITSALFFDHQFTAETLSRYPVVILSNSACLSDAQCDAVRRYVGGGGTLLATAETSLYDQRERFRGDFALSDVLGVRLLGKEPKMDQALGKDLPPDDPRRPYCPARRYRRQVYLLKSHAATRGLPSMGITALAWFRVEADPDRKILATWADEESGTNWTCVNSGLEITGDSNAPVIVAGKYRKGKVIYIAPDIAGTFLIESAWWTRNLIANCVRWLKRPAVELQGPRAVMMTTNLQPERNRLAVHLVNVGVYAWAVDEGLGWGCAPPVPLDSLDFPMDRELPVRLYNPTDYRRYQPRSDFPDRETYELAMRARRRTDRQNTFEIDEYLPVFDLAVSVDTAVFPVARAKLYPDGTVLVMKRKHGKAIVRIPRLDIHAAVVLSLENGGRKEGQS